MLVSKHLVPVRATLRGARPAVCRRVTTLCRAQQQGSNFVQKVASAGAAVLLTLSSLAGAPASALEFDILNEPTPTTNYIIDDAAVLSTTTQAELNRRLKFLESQTGYRLEVVTVRRLEPDTDAFTLADKIVEKWYPENSDKKGVLLVVTNAKDGALTGGQDFVDAVGDDLITSIVEENIPIFTEEEKYDQTVSSSVERVEAKLNGAPVPDMLQEIDCNGDIDFPFEAAGGLCRWCEC